MPELYEIVPTDPLTKLERKSEKLEKEIKEIKEALRGAVGFSKLEENAHQFIEQMLSLLSSAQKLVEDVSKSNKEMAEKIQEGIEKLNQTNQEISLKLAKILNFFSEAAKSLSETEEEMDVESIKSAFSESIKELKSSLDALVEQNRKTHALLTAIENNLRKQLIKSKKVERPPIPPGLPTPPGGLPPPPPPP